MGSKPPSYGIVNKTGWAAIAKQLRYRFGYWGGGLQQDYPGKSFLKKEAGIDGLMAMICLLSTYVDDYNINFCYIHSCDDLNKSI